MPNVCETGSCSSAYRTSHAPLFLAPTRTAELTWGAPLISRSCDGFAGDAAGQDARAEEGALERAAPMDAAAAEAGRFAHGVQPCDGVAVRPQHAARKIGLDAAQALAREDELADGDERHRLLVDDLLELADADAIAAVAAEV